MEEKVKLAIEGDEKAFEYLMNTLKEGLYRSAFAYVKNEEDALDIVQETVYLMSSHCNTPPSQGGR